MACKFAYIAVMAFLHSMSAYLYDNENTSELSFTYMYLLLLVLDTGGGAVGDPFLTTGLPIIAVAVLAILTVLATIILLTYFYRRFVFTIILFIAVVHMLCLGSFMLITCPPIHK